MLTAVEKLKAARAEVVGAIAQLTEEVRAKLLELSEAVAAAEEVGVAIPLETRALLARDPAPVTSAPAPFVAPFVAPTVAPQDNSAPSVGYTPAELREKVLAAVAAGDTRAGQVATRIWGSTALGIQVEAVHSAFAALLKSGLIAKAGRGQYVPAPSTPPSPAEGAEKAPEVVQEAPQVEAGNGSQTLAETVVVITQTAEKIAAIQAVGPNYLYVESATEPPASPTDSRAVDLNPEGFAPVTVAETPAPAEAPAAPVDTRPVGTMVRLAATGAEAPVTTYKRIVADNILPPGQGISASSVHLNAVEAATPVAPLVGDTVTVSTPAGMVFRATVLP